MLGIKENCPNDEQASAFDVPKYVQFLLDNKFFGNKTKKDITTKMSNVIRSRCV